MNMRDSVHIGNSARRTVIGTGLGLAGAVGLLGAGSSEASGASERFISPSDIQRIDSMSEANALLCGSPDEACLVKDANFSVLTLESGRKNAWVDVQTKAGRLALRLRTVVGQVSGGTNNLFVSPFNERVGFNILAVKNRPDTFSLLWSSKSLVSGRGSEVALAGRLPGGYNRGVVAFSFDVDGAYNPPLTHELSSTAVKKVANTLGARAVFGVNAAPR